MYFQTDKADKGKLYMMRFWFDGHEKPVYKIGLTVRQPEERLMDILISYYKVYRYCPKCDIKRFREVGKLHQKETILLASLKEYNYIPEKKFSGCTEMFAGIDEYWLLSLYERVVDNEVIGEVICCG